MTTTRMQLKSLITLANEHNFVLLDDAWMQSLETAEPDLDDMLHVLEWLIKAKETERARTLSAMLLEALAERQDPRAQVLALRVLEWFPDDVEVRRVLGQAICVATPDNQALPGIVRRSGLLDGAPLPAALDYIQTRCVLRPGVFALHRSRRIPVQIAGFDAHDDALQLHDGQQEYRATLVTYQSQYEPLGDDDFRVLRTFRNEQLQREAQTDPAALVRRFLRYSGKRATFRELRDALTDVAVPAAAWKAWWTAVRQTLVHDPHLEVGEGAQPALVLRDSPRDYVETRMREFDHASSVREKIAILVRYAQQVRGGVPGDATYIAYVAEKLQEYTRAADGTVAAFFAWLALRVSADACGCATPDYDPRWLADPATCLNVAHWCGWEALFIEPLTDLLPAADPRWPELYGQMLPQAPLALVERMTNALRASQQAALIEPALHTLAEPRAEIAELLLWLWRELATRADLDFTSPLDLGGATFALFRVMRQLHVYRGGPAFNAHDALATVRHTIAARKYALIGAVFEKLGSNHTAELYHAMSSNAGISAAMRAQLTTLLSRVGLSRRRTVEHQEPLSA